MASMTLMTTYTTASVSTKNSYKFFEIVEIQLVVATKAHTGKLYHLKIGKVESTKYSDLTVMFTHLT